jgi:hypothetical protein
VDLDGDGIPDIVSGSWPGELYLFRGQGKGKFAAGEKIKDKDGKFIKLGSASTVCATNWLGTGKLDLLVGNIQGEVWLVPNKGTKTGNVFDWARKLEVNGEPIRVNHGDSHPIAADWDGDGKLDLLVGTGAGSVLFYRNIGTVREPKLAAPQTLVPESPVLRNPDKPRKEGQCGMRAKICVTDWNGDGRLDLLVGDFASVVGPEPKLTDAEKAQQKEAQEKQNKIYQQYFPLLQRQQKLSTAPEGETPQARQEREKKLAAVQEELLPLQKQLNEISETMRRFYPSVTCQGNVWLFLRRAAPASSSRP